MREEIKHIHKNLVSTGYTQHGTLYCQPSVIVELKSIDSHTSFFKSTCLGCARGKLRELREKGKQNEVVELLFRFPMLRDVA